MPTDPDEVLARWWVERSSGPPDRSVLDDEQALVASILAGTDPSAALRAVARDRCALGFTLAECLIELRVLLDVVPAAAASLVPPWDAAVVVGETFLDDAPSGADGTLTGLVGVGYLGERLREARRRGEAVELTLLTVNLPDDHFDALVDVVCVGAVLRYALRSAIVIAELRPGAFAVLTDPGGATAAAPAVAGAVPDRPLRCWTEPVPEGLTDIEDRLRQMVGHGGPRQKG